MIFLWVFALKPQTNYLFNSGVDNLSFSKFISHEILTSFGTVGLGGIHSLAMYFFVSYLARMKFSRAL